MIHRIEAGKMVIYTNEEGVKQFEDAFSDILKEELDRLRKIQEAKKHSKEVDRVKQVQKDLMRTFIKSLK